MTTLSEMIAKHEKLESKYYKAYKELMKLSTFLQEIEVRQERAVNSNQRGLVYSLKMRIYTIQGVRGCYVSYCNKILRDISLVEHRIRAARMLMHQGLMAEM